MPPTLVEPVVPVVPGIDPMTGIEGGASMVVVVVVVDVAVEGATVVVVEEVVIPRIFDACWSRPDWVSADCAGVRI